MSWKTRTFVEVKDANAFGFAMKNKGYEVWFGWTTDPMYDDVLYEVNWFPLTAEDITN